MRVARPVPINSNRGRAMARWSVPPTIPPSIPVRWRFLEIPNSPGGARFP